MKYLGVVVAAVVGCVVPSTAIASHSGGCPDGAAYVQSWTLSGSRDAGSSDSADHAAGVCVDGAGAAIPGWGFFDGILVEGGAGSATAVYLVADGDDANTDSTADDASAAFVGVNTGFESGAKDTACDNNDAGSGTNSGGCLWLAPSGPGIGGSPLICGNTSGQSWDASGRDGCAPVPK